MGRAQPVPTLDRMAARGLRFGALAGVAALVGVTGASPASSIAPLLPARALTIVAQAGDRLGPLGPIALAGPVAAYTVVGAAKGAPANSCSSGRVYRWNLASGRSSPVSGKLTCGQGESSTGGGIEQIAMAGSRTAWLYNAGGNVESGEILFSSTAIPGKDAILARSDRMEGPESGSPLAGTWIRGLVSDGSRISYSTWTTASNGTISGGALWRLAGPAEVTLARGADTVVASSADAGRVAVLRSDGTVGIYGIQGQLLQTIKPGSAQAVALTGGLVAVLTRTNTMDVYDRVTGTLLHSWPIVHGIGANNAPVTLDASGGIAVYLAGPSIHALDLLTGKDVVLATHETRNEPEIVSARIDSAGLLYDYDAYGTYRVKGTYYDKGTVVFVPFATVATSVGR